MHRLAHGLAIGLLVALGLFLIAFGLLYANVRSMLPFHAAAIPLAHRQAAEPLYFALMKLIGGASIGLGGLGLYLTWQAARLRSMSRVAAIAIAYSIAILTAAYVAETLADATGAPTSWHIMGGLMAALIVACASYGAGVALHPQKRKLAGKFD